MKKLLFSLIFLAVSQVLNAQVDNGLISYFPFTQGYDDVINGSIGTPFGNPEFNNDRFNNFSKSLSLDSQDYVEIEGDLNLSENFTISFWVNFINSSSYSPIINKWYTGQGIASFHIAISGSSINLGLSSDGSNKDLDYLSQIQIADGNWHHIVVSKNGSEIKLYTDLQEEFVGNYTSSIFQSQQNLFFGTQNQTDPYYFTGNLDEVRFYNRALDLNEITNLNNYDENQFWEQGSNVIYHLGRVAINKSDLPAGYALGINGKAIMEEVKVQLSENWPDFVFEKDYELPTLEEVEEHIAEKGHLSEIPSEEDVVENGINLGEMNAKLLQKIEELTLYLIKQNKEIQKLKKEVNALQDE